jgi:adenosylhomocysteine nucleosidase
MVLLATATPWEASAIQKRLPARTGASGQKVELVETGVGAAAAAKSMARYADAADLTLVASCGFAGAVQDSLSTGDLVADVRGLELEWVSILRDSAAQRGLTLALGPVGHAEKILTGADKRRLASDPAARWAAVDMETEAVRDWASRRGVPCLAYRAVLDETDDELPRDWPEGPGWAASLSYVGSHLGSLPLLLRTGRKSAKAGKSLARGIEGWLEKI